MRARRAVLLAAGSLACLPAAAQPAATTAAVAEPGGYRMGAYHAAVPATLEGASVLDTEQAHLLWADHAAIFIDALPRAPKPANLPPDTIWSEPEHDDIPGSVWLPDTGYGQLAPMMEAYFRDNLRAATGGDSNQTLVFYCKADCWHSWNAAKRAVALGYTHVDWYPGGIDGWKRAGFRLGPNDPKPRP